MLLSASVMLNHLMKYVIPQVGELELSTIILDLNGTLTVGGKIAAGVHTQTLLTSYIVVHQLMMRLIC